MRKGYRIREREKGFNLSYHINDQPLPEYNALKDPCLEGYFDRRELKKHLVETGILKKSKNKINRTKSKKSKRPHTTER